MARHRAGCLRAPASISWMRESFRSCDVLKLHWKYLQMRRGAVARVGTLVNGFLVVTNYEGCLFLYVPWIESIHCMFF